MSRKDKAAVTRGGAKTVMVPKLRFPEFRGADGWEKSSMSELSEIVRGGSPRPIDGFLTTDASGLNWLKIGDVDKDAKYVTRTAEKVRREALSKTRFVRPGDLILSNSMSFGRPYILQIETCIHDGWIAITDIAKHVNRDFLYYSISAPSSQRYFADNAAGSGVQNLNAEIIKALSVRLPEQAEQQKIAECLSSADELIAAQARKVDALKAHKKGLMQQLFPREGETQPRLRFPEFQNAGEWVSDSIGNIFKTASDGTPSRTEKAYWNGNIPWITTSQVDFQVISSAEEFITSEGVANSSAKLFPKGTVLMAMYGQGKTRGQVALLGIEAATNQACAAILPRKGIDPYFLFANMAGRYEEIREMSNSGGQENLSQGLVREIQFAFPSEDAEQRKVTSCLSTLDTQITAEAQKLEVLKTHKKSLMQQLFPSTEEVEA
ncbi:restriction endonuclease subunit S [Diaphorobacter caeni]|uniref:restriction endonuclease subunit S n=1 Tax=Diaphorobacter caeni TaxID=2784387 RepID=UPI00188E7127|nr:restriction endonuclease subunit S [Diaphorobacter caeni]MBF5003407.1 restriction endonuclease subunit S [Diaphorobacter caeni]